VQLSDSDAPALHSGTVLVSQVDQAEQLQQASQVRLWKPLMLHSSVQARVWVAGVQLCSSQALKLDHGPHW
jgi:hypothetical protein